MRFLFYSHDGFGLGHTRRHVVVATALAELAPQAAILLATGAEDPCRQGLPRQIEILKLPGLRKDANEKYSSRRLQVPVETIRGLRSALLLSAVRAFEPHVVLVDKHPFGASGEFKAGLKALRRAGGRAVLGLRDILDDPRQVLLEWRKVLHHIADYYDRVLVYGESTVYDPVTAYRFSRQLAERTSFCGYVWNKSEPPAQRSLRSPFSLRRSKSRPIVLACVGGGEDGYRLLSTFIHAAAGAEWRGAILPGPMTPDAELASLEELAKANSVAVLRGVSNLSTVLDKVDGLVCMGGYNTLVEAAAQGIPTVCVPRVEPRLEQWMRAEAFARLGLIQVCHPAQADPNLLRKHVSSALKSPRDSLRKRARCMLDFNGAARAAHMLISLAQAQNRREALRVDEPMGRQAAESNASA